MAIALRGDELVRAMVSAAHQVGDENARLSVAIRVFFGPLEGPFEACRVACRRD